MLAFAAEVTKNEQMAELLSGALAPETLAASFIAVCGEQLDANGQNLIKVMAENGRLRVLPDVLEQFEHLRALSEATAEVEVTSATKLSNEQLAKITAAMEKRLSRKVKLNCKIDKSVMAGVIIRSGDMFIDGSVSSHLERLAVVLHTLGYWSMQLNSTDISELIKQRIAQFNVVSEAHNEGTIVSVSDGVIRIHGLADCMQGE